MSGRHSLKQTSDAAIAPLIPALQAAVQSPGAPPELQVRLRGNILHVLYQSAVPLERNRTLLALVRSLLEDETREQLAKEFPQIYQIYVYNRQPQQAQPTWTAPLYLNRLERHLEQLVGDADRPGDPDKADDSFSAIVLSNLSLARQGNPDAIARYLSEILSTLDVGVRVSARVIPSRAKRVQTITASDDEDDLVGLDPSPDLISRLKISCEASYSPDPLMIAEPVAERLRGLQLTQFQDAVITIHVRGETASDWRLRVDLTPPTEMLREWARWGDLAALERLTNQTLAEWKQTAELELKDTTLHVVCHRSSNFGPKPIPERDPEQSPPVAALADLLQQLAPQGLHRAMLYGPASDRINPDWLKCLVLPAEQHPALAKDTLELARRGDLSAIAYCLTRHLNPDLDEQLATGGIRVQLLLKQGLLHVMTDGPVCPPKQGVVPLVTEYVEEFRWPHLEGLRIYGRRAGQTQPIWSYGSDFKQRQRLVPEAAPEFAASDVYLGDLIAPVEAEPLRPEVTGRDLQAALWRLLRQAAEEIQQALQQTQLFTPAETASGVSIPLPKALRMKPATAIAWGTIGLLLTLQIDWTLARLLRPTAAAVKIQSAPRLAERPKAGTSKTAADEVADGFLAKPAGSNVTSSAIDDAELIYSPQQGFISTSALLAESPFPNFNSKQLNEKLALYSQRVAESGPPDVLVIGSSRALRGVDPAALRQALARVGNDDISVFNFGVNGATAQVVDLVIRQLIPPEQLPRLVIWADGARAFNSGREDITFNSIAVSEGYQELQAGLLAKPAADSAKIEPLLGIARQVTRRYQQVDQSLSQALGQLAATYGQRQAAKALLNEAYAVSTAGLSATPEIDPEAPGELLTGLPSETSMIDFDGFLPLSIRFNPATYYQEYVRVSGAYDSDYKAFRLEGKQSAALEQLLDYAQTQQLPIVFVNTPLTDEYLDPIRSEAEQSFNRYMFNVAGSTSGFLYRDLGQVWTQRYEYFSDPSHLNRYGAYQVSNQLAQDPLIPWPSSE
ncbi:SGNH/GDSL hydrolase family protein [Romeria aff. gracilis LEGE 07310]|uniref:SGNH/GDSL hydrolase family protein n=1 Tax=Vasconcelosia minhoensis LEGE 07310 TaxID=915328 RepID=A0A8J7ADM1_9CYAN|nr:SGNH/GDSL hydrolase family protein [Romeria gracilis]MBE9078011.1 SGNH/GDSL hydrolase family protein [Romeria aff. gracilis LEGE 07310]